MFRVSIILNEFFLLTSFFYAWTFWETDSSELTDRCIFFVLISFKILTTFFIIIFLWIRISIYWWLQIWLSIDFKCVMGWNPSHLYFCTGVLHLEWQGPTHQGVRVVLLICGVWPLSIQSIRHHSFTALEIKCM